MVNNFKNMFRRRLNIGLVVPTDSWQHLWVGEIKLECALMTAVRPTIVKRNLKF